MDNVINQIKTIVSRYSVEKVMLFGSRARGDYSPLSDYDIAIFASRLTAFERARLSLEIDEIATLKKIDLVFVDAAVEDALLKNIQRDGRVLYEPTGI